MSVVIVRLRRLGFLASMSVGGAGGLTGLNEGVDGIHGVIPNDAGLCHYLHATRLGMAVEWLYISAEAADVV